jgi:uncharacterized membrane protein (DUF4010 family)
MDIGFIGLRLFLAFVLGAVLGLEREISEQKSTNHHKPSAVLGVRSFSLVTVLGAIVGLLSFDFMPFAITITAGFFILLIVFYYFNTHYTNDQGFTTEIAVIYSFLIGLLLMIEVIPIQLTLALTIIVIVLLSQKSRIKDVVKDIQITELNAFISFAILAIVILPFLPDRSYALIDIPGAKDFFKTLNPLMSSIVAINIINPFKLWLVVVLVTGVDLIGHILERTIGQKKGWLLASMAGGFVSSTATIQSLAQESRHTTRINHLVAAAVLANLVSFFQIGFLIVAVNANFFIRLTPILFCIIIASFFILLYFLKVRESQALEVKEKIEQKPVSIIDLKAALKFAFLFLVISIFSKVALVIFGQSGFLVATGIGALIGLDAVMINTSQLVGGNINYALGLLAFIFANAVNLGAKSVYSFLAGKKEFAMKFSVSMSLVIISSLLGFLFLS